MMASGRGRLFVLFISSLIFYGYASPLFLLHLLAVSALTYLTAIAIERTEDAGRKRRLLVLALVLLVANLIAFKYTSFLNETMRSLFGWFGAVYAVPRLHIALPLGISFYSFLIIGYLVDVFRGEKAVQE